MSSEKMQQSVIVPAKVLPINKASAEKYYDWHPTREDLMGESIQQTELSRYFCDVVDELGKLTPTEYWFTAANINIYQDSNNPKEYPLAPDVALFKNVFVKEAKPGSMRSWKMYEPNRPAPRVILEISSKDTWKEDLTDKPLGYQKMGVREYFAYDADRPPLWRVNRLWPGIRLRGWRNIKGIMTELKPDKQGHIWSQELRRYLVADEQFLRLYDRKGQRAPTSAEAEKTAREIAEQREFQERLAREVAEQRLVAEQAAMQVLLAKLREKGINPEEL